MDSDQRRLITGVRIWTGDQVLIEWTFPGGGIILGPDDTLEAEYAVDWCYPSDRRKDDIVLDPDDYRLVEDLKGLAE